MAPQDSIKMKNLIYKKLLFIWRQLKFLDFKYFYWVFFLAYQSFTYIYIIFIMYSNSQKIGS